MFGLLTARNKEQENDEENDVRPDTRNQEDEAEDRHRNEEERESAVELRLIQSIRSGSGGGIESVGVEAGDDGGTEGEPESAEEAENS